MMGRTHALTGWCAGLVVAPLVDAAGAHQAVAFATVTSGFALLPDLDHPGASASRLLGPITKAVSWPPRKASAAPSARSTGPPADDCKGPHRPLSHASLAIGPRDEDCKGTHRHLSHAGVFAVLLGLLTAVGTEKGGPWAVAGVAIFALLLAEDALGDWLLPVAAAAVTWWATSTPDG